MKERPILFSAPMVRAIFSGTKTQTRRVFKAKNGGVWPNKNDIPGMLQILRECPYGQPGDRLWVRETWAQARAARRDEPIRDAIAYAADRESMADRFGIPDRRWRSSIHMPRWASRILLEIVAVRVERLKDISIDDAIAEGVGIRCDSPMAVMEYSLLWESINGPGSWDANPWVWVIEFQRVFS